MKEQFNERVVFGLDIGTRSVVGTVGYLKNDKLVVLAQSVRLHETRAMLDGQIHDIGMVGATIQEVKEELEKATDIHLTDVCIAAAGRVLKTVESRYDDEYVDQREVTNEDIYNLESNAVQKAYREFLLHNNTNLTFYLVGYSTIHYYLNGYQIGNLEGHTAGKVGVELIATFLPEDVVDGLYKACERAGLHVANLTLEPIAAMMVAIPERFRMLNLALIDVGAGTSDICITDEGTIMAYGMIPTAGDFLTEAIAKHCLVDFNGADEIKIAATTQDKVTYMDIMGLKKQISAKEIQRTIKPLVEQMAREVTERIKQLNGDKPVSAVFVVGGGGTIPGYTKAISKYMGLPEERVALRGEEVMKDITFLNDDGIVRDSKLVTPLGICLSFYQEANNFVYVSFNGHQIKMYDNGRLAILDVAMQEDFPNEDLFPKRGQALTFFVNGEKRVVRGTPGEPAVILLNGQPADLHARIHANDIIDLKPSTAGEPGKADINSLPEYKSKFMVNVNGINVEASRFATVGGELQTGYYEIQPEDDIRVLDYDTAAQIAQLLDIEINEDTVIIVNNEKATPETPVYENFKIEFKKQSEMIMDYYKDLDAKGGGYDDLPDAEEEDLREEHTMAGDIPKEDLVKGEVAPARPVITHDMNVIVNGDSVTLRGKAEYVFVDVFDYIDFDLTKSEGRAIVTQLNGLTPDYMQKLKSGDRIEVYWKNTK